ncbi:TRAP transporter large permease subunit, partial [bacterium]|nr:TRAP transporter large permease subunit [bacterium]
MPPIMGIAAFIMAEVMGIPYLKVVVLALVPALLYFLGVGCSVYFAAKREGIGIDRESERESLWRILLSKGFLILPLIVVIAALIAGASLMRVAMAGIASAVVVGVVNPHKRFRLREFLDTLEKGARIAVSMGAILAWVGLTIGLIASSGFGSLVAGTLVRAVGENLILILLITMVASLILGMGMTTVAVYVTLAITVIPGLLNLGVHPYVAHFFAFYFGVLSFVTPPVCIATYAAAGLVNANSTRAGWEGLGLTLSGFLIPFAAVYQPALMLQGSASDAVAAIGTAVLGVVSLSAGLQAYFMDYASSWERLGLAAAGILLIVPNLAISGLGAALLIGIGLLQYRKARLKTRD